MATGDNVLLEFELPFRRCHSYTFAREMKIKLLIAASILVALSLMFIPMIPKPLEDGIWNRERFESVNINLRTITDKLREIEPNSGTLYYIQVQYGASNMRTSLIGFDWGMTQVNTAQYSCWVPEGCPYLIYKEGNTKIGHAILYPELYEDFVKWANVKIAAGKYQ